MNNNKKNNSKMGESISSIEYDSQKLGHDYPAMWLSEIACIKKIIERAAKNKKFINILEYGSGKSTIYFSEFLKNKGIKFFWYAVENYIPCYEELTAMIKAHNLTKNVKCLLKNPTTIRNKDIQEKLNMNDYIYFPRALNIEFDVILVDGRQREKCLKLASEILSSTGTAILHDAEREKYHTAFQYFKNKGDFICENKSPVPGGAQKLWIGERII